MSYQVKVLFADHLGNQYLRHDSLLNHGKPYASGNTEYVGEIPVALPSYSKNKNLLLFKFQVVDTENRHPHPFVSIKSLAISNDPSFSTNHTLVIEPASTGPFAAWYADDIDAIYDENNIYVIKVGDDSTPDGVTHDLKFGSKAYTGTAYSGDLSGYSETTLPRGYFGIDNWSFSGNGGVSTVYFRVVLNVDPTPLSYNTEHWQEVNYPNDVGGYAQIVWQSERTPTPGLPAPIALSQDLLLPAYQLSNGVDATYVIYTGQHTAWRFDAAFDNASHIYQNGIASYVADFYRFSEAHAVISNEANIQPNEWQNKIGTFNDYGGSVGSNGNTTIGGNNILPLGGVDAMTGRTSYRNLAPHLESSQIEFDDAYAVSSLTNYIPSYGSGTTMTPNRDVGGTYDTAPSSTDDLEYRFSAGFDVDASNPDIGIQSAYAVSDLPEDDIYLWCVLSRNAAITGTNPYFRTIVKIAETGFVEGQIQRLTNTSISDVKHFRINEDLRSKITSGSLLEMYVSQNADGSVVVRSYITPKNSDDFDDVVDVSYQPESIYLGSMTCDGWAGALFEGTIYAATGHYVNGATAFFQDAAVGIGSFDLGIDIGSCHNADHQVHQFSIMQTLNNEWARHLDAGLWHTSDLQDDAQQTNEYDVLGDGLKLNGAEFLAHYSTQSNIFEVDFQALFDPEIASEDVYIAVTAQAPQIYAVDDNASTVDDSKLIDRLALVPGGFGNPNIPETVGIVFSKAEKRIYALQLHADGMVKRENILPFAPQEDLERWTVQFHFLNAELSSRKLVVALRRKTVPIWEDNFSNESMEQDSVLYEGAYFDPAPNGLGYYVAFGSLSRAFISNIAIAEQPVHLQIDQDASTFQRQFVHGANYQGQPDLLGQNLLSHRLDAGQFLFKNVPDDENPLSWDILSVESVEPTDPAITTSDIGKKYFIGSIGSSNSGIVKQVIASGESAVLTAYNLEKNQYYMSVSNGASYRLYVEDDIIRATQIEDIGLARLPIYVVDQTTTIYTNPVAGNPSRYVSGNQYDPGQHILLRPTNTDAGVYTLSYRGLNGSTEEYNLHRVHNISAVHAKEMTDITNIAQADDDSYWITLGSYAGLSDGDIVFVISDRDWDTMGMGETYETEVEKPGVYVYDATGVSISATTYYLKRLETEYIESAMETDSSDISEEDGDLYINDLSSATGLGDLAEYHAVLLYGGSTAQEIANRGAYVLVSASNFAYPNRFRLKPVAQFEHLIQNTNLSHDWLVNTVGTFNYYWLKSSGAYDSNNDIHGYYDMYDTATQKVSRRTSRSFVAVTDKKIFNADLATTTPLLLSATHSTIDGIALHDNMVVFVKDQEDYTENGLYQVDGSEGEYTLTRLNEFDEDAERYVGRMVSVKRRIFNDNYAHGGYINDFSNWYWSAVASAWKRMAKVYCQKIDVSQQTLSSNTYLNPSLLNIYMRYAGPQTLIDLPRVKLYADNENDIGQPLTRWVSSLSATERYGDNADQSNYVRSRYAQFKAGMLHSGNSLVQFDLSDQEYADITNNAEYLWLAVELPQGIEMQSAFAIIEGANGPAFADPINDHYQTIINPSHGWYKAESIRHALYANYITNNKHAVNAQTIQCRLSALSNAAYLSFATNISNDVIVDIVAPEALDGSTPILQEQDGEESLAVNTSATQLIIKAKKTAGAPILAFKIFKEADRYTQQSTPWLPWSDYQTSEDNTAQYAVYHHGTTHKTNKGILDHSILNQNFNFDNARSVRVQVLDYAGNITNSEVLAIQTGHYALVDTEPPVIQSINFVDSDRNAVSYFNNQYVPHASLNAVDTVTGIKDFRMRMIRSEWSEWKPLAELIDVISESLSSDGLARIEIQLRDYGNNVIQKDINAMSVTNQAQNSSIEDEENYSKLVFNQVARLKTPVTDLVYISGIKSITYNISKLEKMSASSHIYQLYDSNSQPIVLRSSDHFFDVTFDSTEWTRVDALEDLSEEEYFVNHETGYIHFSDDIASYLITGGVLNATSSINLVQDSALLYSWDGFHLMQVADLGPYNERCLLSLCPVGSLVYMGGASGKLWAYDGRKLIGPIYTEPNELPITALHMHQFQHEPQPYVYMATAYIGEAQPKLYRSAVPLAQYGYGWKPVSFVNDHADLPADVDFTTMTSAYNKLFIGTSDGYVLQYLREKSGTEGFVEVESVYASRLEAQDIGYNVFAEHAETPDVSMPIGELTICGNSVLASISNRPEIWSYTQSMRPNVLYPEKWSNQIFNRNFVYDPEPWQFYSTEVSLNVLDDHDDVSLFYHSNTKNNKNIGWTSISDSNMIDGYREAMILSGKQGQYSVFTYGEGSDWAQVLRASGGEVPSKYTVDIDIMQVSGDGQQGIEISDGRYKYSVLYSKNNLIIKSGEKIREKILVDQEQLGGVSNINTTISAMSASPNLQYPELGTQYLWDFSAFNDAVREDRGPYWIGGPYVVGPSVSDEYNDIWRVTSDGDLRIITEEETTDTMQRYSRSLVLSYSADRRSTNPILYTDFSYLSDDSSSRLPINQSILDYGMQIDTHSRIMVRMKTVAKQGVDYNNAPRLRMAWSHEDAVDPYSMKWIDADVYMDGEYHTYVFEPCWSTGIRYLAFQFVNFEESMYSDAALNDNESETFAGFAAIDYIAVTGRRHFLANPNFAVIEGQTLRNYHEALTQLRIAVSDKKVQVWLGSTEYPIFSEDNFLSETASATQIAFGKLTVHAEESESETDLYSSSWMYGSLRFLIGHAVPPLTRDIMDFKLMSRLPSSGAAKAFAYSQGALHVVADGMQILNDRFFNPDDNMYKCFYLDGNSNTWVPIPTPSNRLIKNSYHPVYVYDASGYKNALLHTAEYGNILYDSS